MTRIRRIEPDELVAVSAPLQTYAFFPSPARPSDGTPMADLAPYLDGNLTLAIEADGVSVAEVAAIPMRQNVRGLVCDMAGISGVASHPAVRRRGYARELVIEALTQMAETGCAVSCLYPFRPSFWGRFGYVGLPKIRTTTFTPSGISHLLDQDLPRTLTVRTIAEQYDTYRAYLHRFLAEHHGFAVLPHFRAVRTRDVNDRWLATVSVGDEVTGVMMFRINGFNADLTVDVLLTNDALSRAALLRHLAQHVDQVARIVLPLAPDDAPELWGTDIEVHTETSVTLPGTPAPMGRVLSLPALAGMQVGPGAITVRIESDPFLAGVHRLDGSDGKLEVSQTSADPDVVLTASGISGLVYGVLDPDEVVARGFGHIPPAQAGTLRSLFPRHLPHLTVGF